MGICTFFGHRDCPNTLRPQLKQALVGLIETQGVDRFYLGSQGRFDAMAQGVLAQLQQQYRHIRCYIVLPCLPGKAGEGEERLPTLFPEGLELVPPRFAIAKRNDWMLRQADVVVCYVTHSWGGAAQYVAKARRQGKQLVFLTLPEG